MHIEEVVENYTLILIDASCMMCHGFGRFVMWADRDGECWFGAVPPHPLPPSPPERGNLYDFVEKKLSVSLREDISSGDLDSIIVVHGGQTYIKSRAVLHVFRQLPRYRQWTRLGYLIPRRIADRIYDWVARNRIGWFGQHEGCDLSQVREFQERVVEYSVRG